MKRAYDTRLGNCYSRACSYLQPKADTALVATTALVAKTDSQPRRQEDTRAPSDHMGVETRLIHSHAAFYIRRRREWWRNGLCHYGNSGTLNIAAVRERLLSQQKGFSDSNWHLSRWSEPTYSDRLIDSYDEVPPQNAKHQDVVLRNPEALNPELAARMVGSREGTF